MDAFVAPAEADVSPSAPFFGARARLRHLRPRRRRHLSQRAHGASKDASFEIPTGTITALVGVNGSGKSTLFKAIMGFVPVARGEIRVLGQPVKAGAEGRARRLRAAGRGGRLVLPGARRGRGDDGPLRTDGLPAPPEAPPITLRSRTRSCPRGHVRLSGSRQIGELSGGQRKRVFLARALAQDGRVILLDEPFTGVDVKTEDAIIGLLREMRAEGRVMLVSTHNLGSVPEFCDRTVLVKGTVLAYGPTEDVFTRAATPEGVRRRAAPLRARWRGPARRRRRPLDHRPHRRRAPLRHLRRRAALMAGL